MEALFSDELTPFLATKGDAELSSDPFVPSPRMFLDPWRLRLGCGRVVRPAAVELSSSGGLDVSLRRRLRPLLMASAMPGSRREGCVEDSCCPDAEPIVGAVASVLKSVLVGSGTAGV